MNYIPDRDSFRTAHPCMEVRDREVQITLERKKTGRQSAMRSVNKGVLSSLSISEMQRDYSADASC